MDESGIGQAGSQAAKASASASAGKAAKSAAKEGSKLKKAWEWGEHIHFGYEVVTLLVPPVFSAIKYIYTQTTEAAVTVTQATIAATEMFWRFVVLTAPLTFAVAVILASIRRKWFSGTELVRVPFAGIVLVGSAYLSGWSGVGKAFDWQDVVGRSEWLSSNPMVATLMEWFRLPFFALWQYCQVYGWPTFLLSIVAGCFLGSAVKERVVTAH
jgi:hypothetical protein